MVKTMRKKKEIAEYQMKKRDKLSFREEIKVLLRNAMNRPENNFFWQKKRCGKASRSGKRRMAFGSLLCFLQQADRWDDVPCLRRISKQWLRYSLKAAAYGNNNVAECSRNYRYSYIHTKKWSHSQRKRAHPQ